MKKITLIAAALLLSISICSAQTRKTPVKKVEPKTVEPQTVTEFSETEWKILTDALQAEDWKTAAALAAQYLEKLKTDNEKKQLAQLRYFYLYALAGKILHASAAVKIPIETDSLWKELDAAVGNFTNKEFVLPPHRALTECKEVLNYICPAKDNDRLLRVTATNEEGTMIHSFNYVLFDEKIALDEFAGKEVFLGGRLKRAEFNQDMSKLWVMRLIFEKGFAKATDFTPVTSQNDSPFIATYVGGNTPPTVEVFNDSDRTMYFDLGQGKITAYTILSGASQKITLTEGNYNFKVSAPNVKTLIGKESFQIGYVYTWRFTIVKVPR